MQNEPAAHEDSAWEEELVAPQRGYTDAWDSDALPTEDDMLDPKNDEDQPESHSGKGKVEIYSTLCRHT